MKKISLIGSTGSIGRQVIECVKRHSGEYKIIALVSNSGGGLFDGQVEELKPAYYAAAGSDPEYALSLAELPEADLIFNAASGFAGLEYSYRAVNAGKRLALANKETLVAGGELIMPLAAKTGAEILPVDSEHSAIWQCLGFDLNKPFKRLIITASGGPFKGVPYNSLGEVSPETALNHPTWKMGKKITVDSATLMNKGYEVIEAHMLYGADYRNIETVIQPQSIVHSLVEFNDGAVLAQTSLPTMEIPVQLALSYPERLTSAVAPMDFKRAFSLEFEPLEREFYPCYDLALECGECGGTAPCVLNAADETAVNAFLAGRIKYTDIYRVVKKTAEKVGLSAVENMEQLKEIDGRARTAAEEIIKRC